MHHQNLNEGFSHIGLGASLSSLFHRALLWVGWHPLQRGNLDDGFITGMEEGM